MPPEITPLVEALEAEDTSEIARLLLQFEYTMIDTADEDLEDDGKAAMTAEVEDAEALVAFLSEEQVGQFLGSMEEMFEEGDEVPCFTVDGDNLLEYLPEGFGLLLNPETDDCLYLTPETIQMVKGTRG